MAIMVNFLVFLYLFVHGQQHKTCMGDLLVWGFTEACPKKEIKTSPVQLRNCHPDVATYAYMCFYIEKLFELVANKSINYSAQELKVKGYM